MKKVEVIYNACIGCGKCYAICPEVFTLDDEGIAVVRTAVSELSTDVAKQVTVAQHLCPTHAIKLEKY